jgi:hypothetical protein
MPIQYSFNNELETGIDIGNSQIIPMQVIISDIDIYSGMFNSMDVFFSNIPPYNNYQLLSMVEIPNETSSITRSIDLPAMSFGNESVNMLFKYKDARGNYSP